MSCISPLLRIDYEKNKYRLERLFGSIFCRQFLRKPSNGAFFVSEVNFLRYFPDYLNDDELASAVCKIGCGQCIECRLAKSREWALRIMLESQAYKHNYFVTLTYNDDYLPLVDEFDPSTGEFRPDVPTLEKKALSAFVKRLRSQCVYKFGHDGIKFFGCGEYGELHQRSHYHICLMNMPDLTEDLVFFSRENNITLYRSPFIESCWVDKEFRLPIGFVTVGDLTWDSAAYTARYIMKKQLGKTSTKNIIRSNEAQGLTGSSFREPEFILMSRRPGIAYDYFKSHSEELYDHDSIVAKFGDRVYEVKPPVYFDRLYDNVYSSLDHARVMQQLRIDRSQAGLLSERNKMLSSSCSRAELIAKSKGQVIRREKKYHKRNLEI